MTSRTFITGVLSALLALVPITGYAHHNGDSGALQDTSFDDLYNGIDVYGYPHSVRYDSPYYGHTYNEDYLYTAGSRGTYDQQSLRSGFRCYYWGRDGTCMNYTYRQMPSYYGSYPYGYDYGYNSYGYKRGCGYRNCY